ncbi:MAG: hypothetical protein PW788_01250 [Micavibrio sp.]|nr:hypothetical protein [Micavibrio sp.]
MADWLNKGIKAVTGALKSMQGEDANNAGQPEETAAEKASETSLVKRKPFKLKFSVSNESIRKMAVKTLQAGGMDIQDPPPKKPRPADPFTPSPRAEPAGSNLRDAFRQAAMDTAPPQAQRQTAAQPPRRRGIMVEF